MTWNGSKPATVRTCRPQSRGAVSLRQPGHPGRNAGADQDRSVGKGAKEEELLELPGPLAPPAPGGHVGAIRAQDPQFVRRISAPVSGGDGNATEPTRF